MSSSNYAVCGSCSAKIISYDEALICHFYDAWLYMKCCRLSDEVYTLIAESEVASSILWFCQGCNRAFPQAKSKLKSIQFMESKLNESDVKLSNLSTTVDDVEDRLSKVEHMCQTSSGLSTTDITTHLHHDLPLTARECIDEEKVAKKVDETSRFSTTEPTNITNAVGLGRSPPRAYVKL